MDTLFHIFEAIGAGAAAGLSPIVALAAVILLAAAGLGIDPAGSDADFVSEIGVMAIAGVALAQSFILTFSRGGTRFRVTADRPHALVLHLVVAVVLGAIAGAVVFAAEQQQPLIGALIAVATTAVVAPAASGLLGGVSRRIAAKEQRISKDDPGTDGELEESSVRNVLAFGTDVASIGAVVAALLMPPAAVALPLLAVLVLVGSRRRQARKHEGLRILR